MGCTGKITLDSLRTDGPICRLQDSFQWLAVELQGDTLHIAGESPLTDDPSAPRWEYHYWLDLDQAQCLLDILSADCGEATLEGLALSARPDLWARDPFGEYFLENGIFHRYSADPGELSFLKGCTENENVI